jgi:trk system potassium uptake protein
MNSFFVVTSKDLRLCFKELALVIRLLSFVMLWPLVVTAIYVTRASPLDYAITASAFILPASILYLLHQSFNKYGLDGISHPKHIMITISLAWFIVAVVGAIPFYVRGVLNPFDSFFESMSGWTTTGYSMIPDLEVVEKDLLFYRSLSEGVGGLGLVSIGMLILLQGGRMGVGYSNLGIQRIRSSLKGTIIESWKIYGLFILFGTVMLYLAGMTVFDAINHSMTSIATGGFSTHNSISYYNSPFIELILILLMILGMTSFLLHFRLFNGDRSAILSEELKYCWVIIIVSVLVLTASIFGKEIPGVNTYSLSDVLRKATFHVVSGMSTCGFSTLEYSSWPGQAKTWMIGLMYVGGMSSSTAGGIHVIRFLILLKAIHYCFKRLILPRDAIVLLKVDKKPIYEDVLLVVGYSAVYLLVSLLLSLILMYIGYAPVDSVFTITSAMGNDGLAAISGDSWYHMPYIGKLTVIVGMWIGRVEIFPGLLILTNLWWQINNRQ